MAGVTLLDRTAGLTATVTRGLDTSNAVASRARFYAEITTVAATAATWDLTLQVTSPDGTNIPVATGSIGVETLGVVLLTTDTGFAGETGENVVPLPSNILYTETSTGSSFTGDVFVIWS